MANTHTRLNRTPFSPTSQAAAALPEGLWADAYFLLETARFGDLDLFLRYDVIELGQDGIQGSKVQQALRMGVNYNLPFSRKLANLLLEYARNAGYGPHAIVPETRSFDEFRVELRFSLTRYLRH